MVRHGDGGAGYQHLDYKRLPHSEYRTIIHVIVQISQPNFTAPDKEGWQRVADLWNHIFAADLQKFNVRAQDAKHWRDQYVHREASGRPAEWKQICKPDAEQSAEEMGRRAGYRRRIADAARDLGIQLPAGSVPQNQPSAAPAKRKKIPMSEGPMTFKMVKHGDHENSEELSDAETEYQAKKVVRSGKGYVEVAVPDDEEDEPETYEKRFMMHLADDDDSLTPTQRFEAAARRSKTTAPRTSRPSNTTMTDEAHARSLQEEEDRSQRSGRAISAANYASDEEADEDIIAAAESLGSVPAKQKRGHPRKQKVSQAVDDREDAGKEPKPSSIAEEMAEQTPSPLDKLPHVLPIAWTKKGRKKKEGSLSMRKQALGNSMQGSSMQSHLISEPQQTAAPDQVRNRGRDDTPRTSRSLDSLFASPSTTQSGTAPSPLPMIHGNRPETLWYDGVPYAWSTPTPSGGHPPSLVRPSTPQANRALVLRGFIDDKEQDVMMCMADECGWCDSNAGNKTLGSSIRSKLGLPVVHSSCIQRNYQSGKDEFVPVEGLGYEWAEPLPNQLRSAKVVFRDGVERAVSAWVEKRCGTCAKVRDGRIVEGKK